MSETPTPTFDVDATSEDNTIGASLFGHSIILYCRATETKPTDRLKWFGRDMLTSHERAWHVEVMDFRDHVLAHFGHGKSLNEGPTIRHALVLQIPLKRTNEMAVEYIEHRASTRAALSVKLEALLETTTALARKSFDDRLKDMQTYLFGALNNDERFRDIALECRYDGSLHDAGRPAGYTTGEEGPWHYRIAAQ